MKSRNGHRLRIFCGFPIGSSSFPHLLSYNIQWVSKLFISKFPSSVSCYLFPRLSTTSEIYIRVTKLLHPGDQVSEIPAASRRTVTREIYQQNHRSPARYLLLAIIAVCEPIIDNPTIYQYMLVIYCPCSPAIPCQVLLPFPISPPFSSSKTSESSRETSLPWHASGL